MDFLNICRLSNVTFSKYIGDFKFHESGEGEPVVNNDAAVFVHSNGKLFLYRGKDGDWLIGIVFDKEIDMKNEISQALSLATTRKVFF